MTTTEDVMEPVSLGPLAGVRVLDFSANMAGPCGAMMLAQLSADVIKVEPLSVDDSRAWPPFVDGMSLTHRFVGAGKRALVVDLRQPKGLRIAKALIARSDAVLQSMRPGVAERLGIGAQATRQINPQILHYDFSAFGLGPSGRARPGYDPLVQAFSGIMMMTGYEGDPTRCAPSLIDLGTGQWIAMGVLAAIMAKRAGQPVSTIDTALIDTAFSVAPYQAIAARLTGQRPDKAGSGNPIASPYQCFRSRDADLLIAAPSQRLWELVARTIGAPELLEDPDYATVASRSAHRDTLAGEINRRLAAEDVATWVQRLYAAGVPVTRVQGLEEAAASEIAAERQTFVRSDRAPLVRPPWLLDGSPLAWRLPAPWLGEHAMTVLAELGFDEAQRSQWLDEGVIMASASDD